MSRQVGDTMGRSHASVMRNRVQAVAEAFAGYEFPKRFCLFCRKEIPLLSKKGYRLKGNFCQGTSCRELYNID